MKLVCLPLWKMVDGQIQQTQSCVFYFDSRMDYRFTSDSRLFIPLIYHVMVIPWRVQSFK